MSASEVRNELTSMRSAMEDINTRMSAYFETISKTPKIRNTKDRRNL